MMMAISKEDAAHLLYSYLMMLGAIDFRKYCCGTVLMQAPQR